MYITYIYIHKFVLKKEKAIFRLKINIYFHFKPKERKSFIVFPISLINEKNPNKKQNV